MTYVLTLAIAAALTAPAVFPSPESSATFHYVFSGHFWNGAPVAADRTDTVKSASGTVELSAHDNDKDTTARSEGTLGEDGTATFADKAAASDPFAPYNAVALLVRGAPSYASGAKWNTLIPVQTGQTAGELTPVPIAATVARVDGDAVTVEGTGKASGISSYGEYHDPIDLTIQVAARFSAGNLQRADYKATEYVHAGPLSQPMTWRWSLSRE
jgi:hypothetical protein